MKNLLRLLFLLSVLLFFESCRKVKKIVTAEKPFVIFFADTSGQLKGECFDRVYGQNNSSNLKNCSDPLLGLDLPLSIVSDSTTFLFVKGSNTDTIKIVYTKAYKLGSHEYEVSYVIKDIVSSKRFSSISRKCIPEISSYCNGDQTLFAIIYL